MEAVGAAQDVAHLVGLQFLERLGEERGQARGGAPAEGSALQRIRRVREGRRDLREIRAAAQLGERLKRAAPALLDRFGVGLRGAVVGE